VTPEQRKYAIEVFDKSVAIANDVGPIVVDKANDSTAIATTTAAILLCNFCITSRISMYDAVDILMSTYKNILEINKDES
jgi:hypothetical protein